MRYVQGLIAFAVVVYIWAGVAFEVPGTTVVAAIIASFCLVAVAMHDPSRDSTVVGDMVVDDSDDERRVFTLSLDVDPSEFTKANRITFRVVKQNDGA